MIIGLGSYSESWFAYKAFFSASRHRSVSKCSSLLSHVERWRNRVRQRLARYVRRSLSFSKSIKMHELVTRWFILVPGRGVELRTPGFSVRCSTTELPKIKNR